MSTTARRALMAAAGAAVLATGLVVAPSTGGAIDAETSVDVPTTTIELPDEVGGLVETVEELTGSTVTSSTTTTTTPPEETTTTTAAPTTTTTLPVTTTSIVEQDDDGDEVEEAVEEVVDDLDIPLISVEELAQSYQRVEFPNYQPVFGKRSTMDVISILDSNGATFEQQAAVLAPFPVVGPASYHDDWGAARHIPEFHLHVGVDVFAERGTPVVASADGRIDNVRAGTAVGGNSLRVTTPDGTYFYYAHLDDFAPLVTEGMPVRRGQVIGTVGDTGNARGTPPHLHFEIHPGGGEPVPPAPYLDAWLAAALEKARGVAADLPPIPVPEPLGGGSGVGPQGPAATPIELARLDAEPAAQVHEVVGLLFWAVPIALFVRWRRKKNARTAVELEELLTG